MFVFNRICRSIFYLLIYVLFYCKSVESMNTGCFEGCTFCVDNFCEECNETMGLLSSCAGCKEGYFYLDGSCYPITSTVLTCSEYIDNLHTTYDVYSKLTISSPFESYICENVCSRDLPPSTPYSIGYYFTIHITRRGIYQLSSSKDITLTIQRGCQECFRSIVLSLNNTYLVELTEGYYIGYISSGGEYEVSFTYIKTLSSIMVDYSNSTDTDIVLNDFYIGRSPCFPQEYSGCGFSFTGDDVVYKIEHKSSYLSYIGLFTMDDGDDVYSSHCIVTKTGLHNTSVLFRGGTEKFFFASSGEMRISVACDTCDVCSDNALGCICSNNHTAVNGSCTLCGNGIIDTSEGEECELGDDHCDQTCHCDNESVLLDGKCVTSFCGNGRLDDDEECDGGVGCDEECKCTFFYYTMSSVDCNFRYVNGVFIIPTILILYWTLFAVVFIFTCCRISWFNYIMTNMVEGNMNKSHGYWVEFHKGNKKYIKLSNLVNYVNFTPSRIQFVDSNRVEVDKSEKIKISITNCRKETMSFILHGIDDFQYTITFDPPIGDIKGGHTMTVKGELLMRCTKNLKAPIPVTIRWNNKRNVERSMEEDNIYSDLDEVSDDSESEDNSIEDDEEDKLIETDDKFMSIYTYVQLEAESEVSTRLDYEEFRIDQPPVGSGTFGIVYRVMWRRIEVAVKVLKTDLVSSDDLLPNFEKEALLMEKLRCQNIVNFIGTIVGPETLCIVTEYCPLGSLCKFMTTHKLGPLLKIRFCQDIAHGMEYLHSNDIIHHDLKTDNVLVVSKNPYDQVVAKVSDFGTSQAFIKASSDLLIQDVGTPLYMAPEVHQSGQMNFKSDVFSYAICLLEVWLTYDPYPIEEFQDGESILDFVCSGQRLKIPSDCIYGDLIRLCWKQNPEKRPSFSEITQLILPYLQDVMNANKKADGDNGEGSEENQNNAKDDEIFDKETSKKNHSPFKKLKTKKDGKDINRPHTPRARVASLLTEDKRRDMSLLGIQTKRQVSSSNEEVAENLDLHRMCFFDKNEKASRNHTMLPNENIERPRIEVPTSHHTSKQGKSISINKKTSYEN